MNEPADNDTPSDAPPPPPDSAQASSQPAVELPPPGDPVWYQGPGGLRRKIPDL